MTTALQRALVASHVLTSNITPASPITGGATGPPVPFSDGQVEVDAGRPIRRILRATIPDPRWLPDDPTDVLNPYSGRLKVRQGVQFPDGSRETYPLGVFRIYDIAGDDTTGPVELTAYSLESLVVDDRFESPRQASGPSCVAMATTLIKESDPTAVVVVDPGVVDAAVPIVTWDQNRWAAVVECVTKIGCTVYVDATGTWRISPVVDPATATPVAEIRAGDGGTLKSVRRGYSRDGVYNAVVARSSAMGTADPIQGVWRDLDPNSPTRWGGPFAKVPRYYTSPLLTTVAQCELAAQTIGLKSLGLARSVQIEAVPRPDVEPGTAIRLVPDPVNKPSGQVHVLESFPIRLVPGGARWVARTRTTTYDPDEAS